MGKTTKKDYEYIYNFFKEKGFNLETKEYVGAREKMVCIDEFGYKYYTTYNKIQCGKNPNAFDKSNPYCIQNINTFLKRKNADCICVQNIEDYQGTKKEIKFKCNICGEIFYKKIEIMKRNDYYFCKKCRRKNGSKKIKKPIDEIFFLLKDMKYDILYIPNNYKRTDKIKVRDFEGYIGYTKFLEAKKGSKFKRFHIALNKDNYLYNLQNYCNINNINIEILSFSKNNLVNCKCGCGNTFISNLNLIKNGKTRCEKCSNRISKYQYLTNKYLDEIGVKYINEYRFSDCRNILPLPFDIKVSKENKVIEIDGKQHEIPVDLFGGRDGFVNRKRNDEIKTDYCKNNNIELLRISYREFKNNNYKKIINNFINE